MKQLIEKFRVVNALAPVANAFAGTLYKGVNVAGIGKVFFIVNKGAGGTGTSTITVVGGSNATPSAETAVEFIYQRIAADNTTIGAVTKATTSGFTTTAGAGDCYIIEVDAQRLAATGYKYVHIKLVEVVASAVIGQITVVCTDLANSPNTADIVS